MVVATFLAKFETAVLLVLVAVVVALLAWQLTDQFTHRPQECQYQTSWSDWGPCSRDCQGGFHYRTRGIAALPVNGGQDCDPDLLIQSQSCNEKVVCGQPCLPGNPNYYPWLPCPNCITTGNEQVQQWKIVPPLQTATYMGKDCTIDEVLYSRPCSGNIPACPPDIDCVLGIASITGCSEPCGPGIQTVYQRIIQFPSGNGAPCDFAALVYQQSCSEQPCGDCDSLFSNSVYSNCSVACGPGVQIRMRAPRPDDPNDYFCPFFQTQSCEVTACPNDTCIPPSYEFVEALCYLSCSGLPIPEIYEDLCYSITILNSVCESSAIFGFGNCTPPQNCSLTTWSAWSACSLPQCAEYQPQGGLRTSTRQIVQEAIGGGTGCTDPSIITLITEPCNNQLSVTYEDYNTTTGQITASISTPQCFPEGCQYSDFFPVGPCTTPCGPGSQTLNRSVTQFPIDGGQPNCSTDPNFYLSYTTCSNQPTCTQCIFASPEQFPLPLFCRNAQQATDGNFYVFADTAVVSYTNDPTLAGECRPGNFLTCTLYFQQDPIPVLTFSDGRVVTLTNGLPNGSGAGYDTLSCSAYANICTNVYSECPLGCNGLTCSGNGSAYGESVSGNKIWCSCSCFPGWTGPACSTATDPCPIGPNGLVCNGLGDCDGNTGMCSCPLGDTTPDCTGPAAAWCWIYANYNVTDTEYTNTNQISNYVSVRKMLGAIPIFTTSNVYSFSEADCAQINARGDGTAVDPSSAFYVPELLNSAPTMLPYSFDPQTYNNLDVISWRFSSVVRDSIPNNLAINPSICSGNAYYNVAGFLDYFINTQTTLGTTPSTALNFTQFYPRIIAGTAPTQCEDINNISSFNILNANQIGTTTNIMGSSLTSQTAELQPRVQYVCEGGMTQSTDSFFTVSQLQDPNTSDACPPPPVGSTVTVIFGDPAVSVNSYTAVSALRQGAWQNVVVGETSWYDGESLNLPITLSCLLDGAPIMYTGGVPACSTSPIDPPLEQGVTFIYSA